LHFYVLYVTIYSTTKQVFAQEGSQGKSSAMAAVLFVLTFFADTIHTGVGILLWGYIILLHFKEVFVYGKVHDGT
jgi:hypothetical protein